MNGEIQSGSCFRVLAEGGEAVGHHLLVIFRQQPAGQGRDQIEDGVRGPHVPEVGSQGVTGRLLRELPAAGPHQVAGRTQIDRPHGLGLHNLERVVQTVRERASDLAVDERARGFAIAPADSDAAKVRPPRRIVFDVKHHGPHRGQRRLERPVSSKVVGAQPGGYSNEARELGGWRELVQPAEVRPRAAGHDGGRLESDVRYLAGRHRQPGAGTRGLRASHHQVNRRPRGESLLPPAAPDRAHPAGGRPLGTAAALDLSGDHPVRRPADCGPGFLHPRPDAPGGGDRTRRRPIGALQGRRGAGHQLWSGHPADHSGDCLYDGGETIPMTWYLLLKYIHVLLGITAVGTNITYAVWDTRGAREKEHLCFAPRGVSFLDPRVANPAYGLLLLTGLGPGWGVGRGFKPGVIFSPFLFVLLIVV